MTTELVILKNLCTNERYSRYVLPYIEKEYFQDRFEEKLFDTVRTFILKYNSLPGKDAIGIMLNKDSSLNQKEIDLFQEYDEIFTPGEHNYDWLVETTEKWCKERAVYNAIAEAIEIQEEQIDKGADPSRIVDIMTKAVSISFNKSLGQDYYEDAESRFDRYNDEEEKFDFGWSWLDYYTNGGVPKNTLTCICGPTNGGKSICLSHLAAHYLTQGKNVVYVSFEMGEDVVAVRVDANLLNHDVNDVKNLGKENFLKKIGKLKTRNNGKLFIKEYAPRTANCTHISTYLDDLKRFSNFVPDVVIIDYLTICGCIGYKGESLFMRGQATAEEMRGLGKRHNVPVITAAQYNRSGSRSEDPEIEDIGESHGISQTADLIVNMICNAELELLNQVGFKIAKNRFGPKNVKFNMEMVKNIMTVRDVPGQGYRENSIRYAEVEEELANRTKDLKSMKRDRPSFTA